jgi:hypothetical protein
MRFPLRCAFAAAAAFFALSFVPRASAADAPEVELAKLITAFYDQPEAADWQSVEALPGVRWAPLPPAELPNCLPEAGCFARPGGTSIAGRNVVAVATGARTFVISVFLRNSGPPFGEGPVVTALNAAGFNTQLARCPAANSRGGTNWYRLQRGGANAGFLSVQTACNGRACEGFTLSRGDRLPQLQPNQLALYTENCAAGADRTVSSVVLPHEQVAKTLVALLPPAAGPALYSWDALAKLDTKIQWPSGAAKAGDLSFKGDANPWMQTGYADYSGRAYSYLFSGSPTEVKVMYADENGLHPAGEDVLGLLRSQGFTVTLARCGPVYTESTNNWYRLTSASTKPAMLKQSIRRDGAQFQDAYELRLDASLPARDPRDRDPGVNGCR